VQPFFTLITTFVYAPYFAVGIVGDPARGQALWGFATGVAGLVIALLSPALGAIADAAGNRKPWIAGFSVLLLAASVLLWFGRPADSASIVPVLAAFALGAIGAQCALVFFNSMMPSLVPPDRLGRLSGTAWGVVYVGRAGDRVRRIGVLLERGGGWSTYTFEQRLRELGWKPDLILTKDAPETKAVLEQTHTVPIVFVMCADPVGDGLVQSFARPGGNVTGFSSFEPGIGGKWVELLKEIAPKCEPRGGRRASG
jgi:hypothetical protein